MGLDVKRFLDSTAMMVEACAATVKADKNPGAILGAILGTLGSQGRNKVTLVTSPGIRDLGAWLEQLLAEQAWVAFQVWDRTQRGIFPKGTFEALGGALLERLLKTAAGTTWWRSAKQRGYGFPPGFVSAVDAMLTKT